MTIFERALALVRDGDVVGLGSGHASTEFIAELGVTDNGNHILDCKIAPILHPQQFEEHLRAIPGVVGTGLFLNMADTVLVGDDHFHLIAERQRKIP